MDIRTRVPTRLRSERRLEQQPLKTKNEYDDENHIHDDENVIKSQVSGY